MSAKWQAGNEMVGGNHRWYATRRLSVVVALTLTLVGARGAAAAESPDYASEAGLGVASIFCDVLYMPVKFVYATLGGITGGFAYVLTGFNYDLAKGIWVPSTGGDYVITPSMLRGDQPIYFSGTTQPKHESRAREEEDLGTSGRHDPEGTKY